MHVTLYSRPYTVHQFDERGANIGGFRIILKVIECMY